MVSAFHLKAYVVASASLPTAVTNHVTTTENSSLSVVGSDQRYSTLQYRHRFTSLFCVKLRRLDRLSKMPGTR